jgi:shikimate kinase
MRTEGASIEPGQKKARVVEIIGPAGAGKTSLYTSLDEFPAQILLSNFPDVHKITDAPFFVRYGLQLLPSLARYFRPDSRPFSRREFAWMSIMVGWPTLLQKQIRTCPQVIILDQGPVYLLAEMREFGPDFIRAPKAEQFWQEVFSRWAQTLDMIVWLDAADAVLLERIRTREQDLLVKDETDAKMIEYLNCYRRIFESTVTALQVHNPHMQVLRFDTGISRTIEIREQILANLDVRNEGIVNA